MISWMHYVTLTYQVSHDTTLETAFGSLAAAILDFFIAACVSSLSEPEFLFFLFLAVRMNDVPLLGVSS